MQRNTAIAVALFVLAATLGVWMWFQNRALEDHLNDMGRQIEELTSHMEEARDRAREAETRATEAEKQAAAAADRAGAAAERADKAEAESEAAEQRALTEQERAQQAYHDKLALEEVVKNAQEAREQAEEEAYYHKTEAELARLEKQDAEKELERLRQQREEAMNRLQRSLEKIAETRRSKLGLIMNLGDSIEFDFDRAELRPKNRELLSRIAGVLMTAEGFHIEVFGHTDDVGDDAYNQQLSERRAQSVRDYLVANGIDEEVISTRGFGKSQPLVEGTTAEARQRNRRVEIAVVHVEGQLAENPLVEPADE